MLCIEPTVDKIFDAGNINDQATMIRAVVDHPASVAAHTLAGILSTKEQTAALFVSKQTARMLGRACSNIQVRGKSKREKCDATKVGMSFSAPSPTLPSMIWETVVPSQCDCAKLFRIPRSTCRRVDIAMITKRQQLTAGERGIYWAQATTKRGYLTISDELKSIFVLPNTKDTLQVKNDNGDKVLVRKILTMVGLGTIFSDIVRGHPTIKNKVGEHAFWYIDSGHRRVCRFTDPTHTKQCVDERSAVACINCIVRCRPSAALWLVKLLLNAQRCTTKACAEEMVRGWGEVVLHPKPSDAIRAGTCTQWSANDVPHWDCQTLKCKKCKEYPGPDEEAHEDAGAKDISFHVYE